MTIRKRVDIQERYGFIGLSNLELLAVMCNVQVLYDKESVRLLFCKKCMRLVAPSSRVEKNYQHNPGIASYNNKDYYTNNIERWLLYSCYVNSSWSCNWAGTPQSAWTVTL
jgi:hypothetical protein